MLGLLDSLLPLLALSPPSSGKGGAALDSDRLSIMRTGLGLLSQTWNVQAPGTQSVLTSGTIYCCAAGFRSGDVVTNMLCSVATAGAGTAPTLIRQGVADSTGKMLAVTADTHASAVWTALGLVSVALSAPLTIPGTGLYYLCFIEVGAFGTTPMQLRAAGNSGGGPGAVAGFPRALAAQAGQTDLPAVNASLTLGGGGTIGFWQAVN
jgi:hypothetical protein